MRRSLAITTAVVLLLAPSIAVAEEVGGWAVIDPATGTVHGVIVCTESVCGEAGQWGGVLRGEYSGCTDCILRKQTHATADGNVAGWASSEATDVTYDGDESGSYTIVQGSGDERRTMTLVPERTATDPDRMDLSTGIVQQRTERRLVESERTAEVTVEERRDERGDLEVDHVGIEFTDWDRSFRYGSAEAAVADLESDVDAVLTAQADAVAADDPEAGPDGLVQAIRALAQRVVRFLTGWVR